MKPEISVIIPTLGKRFTLAPVLKALESCLQKHNNCEVLIVENTQDGNFTLAELPSFAKVLHCPKPGAASARNLGAFEASGEFLLFLDDDAVPQERIIEAHLNCLNGVSGRVSMGKLLPAKQEKEPLFFEFALANLLPDYDGFKEGSEVTPQHFNSANFMAKKEDFLRIGGFDEGFDCYGFEDVEFGRRLEKYGITTVFSAKALALHHFDCALDAYLLKMKLMGSSAVRLVKAHPELAKLANILNYDRDRGVFRYDLKKIAEYGLEENFGLLACREFADRLQKNGAALRKQYNFKALKDMVFECYTLLLRHEYLLGFKDAFLKLRLKEKELLLASLKLPGTEYDSLFEEVKALRGVIEYKDKHPLRHLAGRISEKLKGRKPE